MSREWPSGWEDPEDVELDAEELDAETGVRLSEVAAFLTAVPAPVLPGAIESRIVAALAAESAARAENFTTDPAPRSAEPDRSRTLGPAPARARVRRHRRLSLRPAQVSGALLACLLFVGLGFVVSLSHGASSSSSAPQAASAASSAAASSEAGPQMGYSSDSTGRSAAGSGPSTSGFALTRSGTDYQEATLAGQVREVIAANEKAARTAVSSPATPTSGPASVPAASASATQSLNPYALTPSLHGCVVHFTGRAAPRLIDRASYEGTPAYVIAGARQVWVVGLGCTATHPHLITSAPLGS